MKRQEQLGMSSPGEQKTFHKASRRGNSRAATGRGAGRACCGDSTSTGGAQDSTTKQAPPDMQTGQSIRACLRREVPADHEAHSQPQRRQLRRVAKTKLRRESTPEAEARKARPWQRTTIAPHADAQSRLVQSGDTG